MAEAAATRPGLENSVEAGETALLLALGAGVLADDRASDIPSDSGTPSGSWLFVAVLSAGPDAADATFWSALADLDPAAPDGRAVRPHPRAEEIYTDPDTAHAALCEHAGVTSLAGIAIATLNQGRTPAPALLDMVRTACPGVTIRTVIPRPRDLPVFSPAGQLPLRLIGTITIGVAAVLILALTVIPMIAEALKPAPPPPPAMVHVGPDASAFGDTCTGALGDWWPRIAGWERSGAGCALAGHLSADQARMRPEATSARQLPIVIWQDLRQTGQVNTVLAASAATRVLERWPHMSHRDGTTILLWQTRALDLVVQDETTDETGRDLHQARAIKTLASLFAETPDAVARGAGDTVTISAPGDIAGLFGRAARAKGLTPVRFDRPDTGRARLVLAPARPRTVPLALFDGAAAAAAAASSSSSSSPQETTGGLSP